MPTPRPTTLRILHLHSGKPDEGVELLLPVLAACRNLAPQMEPEFGLCFEGRLSEKLAAARATLHRLGGVHLTWPWDVFRARRWLARMLKAGGYDVVICHSPWTHTVFAPAVRDAGTRLALFLHSPIDEGRWIDRWAGSTEPDLIFANSRFVAESVERVFPSVVARVLYPPVVPQEPVELKVRTRLRAELSTPEDDWVIVQAGRMAEGEGHARALQALAMLRDVPSWTCWLAGGAQSNKERRYEEQLRALAVQWGVAERVRFVGQHQDLWELFSAADVFCQPNTSPESFAPVLVQAMAAGLPVVGTAVGCTVEIVGSTCGFLVSEDVRLLSRAFRRLAVEPELRERLGAAAQARARALSHPRIRLNHLAAMLK